MSSSSRGTLTGRAECPHPAADKVPVKYKSWKAEGRRPFLFQPASRFIESAQCHNAALREFVFIRVHWWLMAFRG